MERVETEDGVTDAGWRSTLAALLILILVPVLVLVPAIAAFAPGWARGWFLCLGIVAYAVARVKLLTMLWGLAQYIGDLCRALVPRIIATGQARLSLAALAVLMVAIAIPRC